MGTVIKPPPRDAAPEEHHFAELVHKKGSSDLYSLHHLRVGGREVDAVVIDKGIGRIYVVEVKGWSPKHQRPKDDEYWEDTSKSMGGVKEDPFHQAENCNEKIRTLLHREKRLIQEGGDHQGHLKYPVHSGIAFFNYPKDSLRENFSTNEFFDRSLFAEDLDQGNMSKGKLDELLLRIEDPKLKNWRPGEMGKEDLDLVVSTLRRSSKGALRPDSPQTHAIEYPIENRYLEVLGHAGTGKSVVIIRRAQRIIREHSDWNVLILCRNIMMRHWLSYQWDELGTGEKRPEIRDFNSWSRDLGFEGENFTEESVDFVKTVGRGKYQAILVDEGQDFNAQMLTAIREHLDRSQDPKTRIRRANSFTICRDRWQDIWKNDVGLNLANVLEHTVSGPIELDREYRCLVQIVRYARTYVLTAGEGLDPDHPTVLSLYSDEFERSFPSMVKDKLGKIWRFLKTDIGDVSGALKSLDAVTVCETDDQKQVILSGIESVLKLQEAARVEGEGSLTRIAIVYTYKWCIPDSKSAGDTIVDWIKDAGIRHYYVSTNGSNGSISPRNEKAVKTIFADKEPHVVIANVWQIKGLDADAVIFVGADCSGMDKYSSPENINYVGLTRGRVLLQLVLSQQNRQAAALKTAFETYTNLSSRP